jgi:long-chain acyl-CoA synthetase
MFSDLSVDASIMTASTTTAEKITRPHAIARLTAAGQPYELVTVEMYGRPCRAFRNAPPTLRDLYAQARSNTTFWVYGGHRFTFEDAYQHACRIATVLVERYQIRKGDRVAISMRNYPEWMLAFSAVTSIGAIAVAMNALWQTDEMAYGLEDSGAKVLFADQERIDRVLPVYQNLGVGVIAVRPSGALPDDIVDLEDLLSGVQAATMPPVDLEPDDDATILYTSGSTGHPKGAVSSHRNIISALLSWELDGQVSALINGMPPPSPNAPQPAVLLAVPLFHVTGLHAVALSSFRAQRKVVSMYKWNVDEATALIERERVSSVTAPAAITGDLVEAARHSERDLSSLAVVGGGGAPRAPEQVQQIARALGRADAKTRGGVTATKCRVV